MSRPLRLGVDAANVLVDRRGIGRYARSLLQRFADLPERVELTLLMPQLFPNFLARRLADVIGRRNFRVARRAAASRLNLDVVWYPWNGMTWIAQGPKAATVHDVWPFVSPSVDPKIRRNEQTPFRNTAEHANLILADSQFIRSEIISMFGVAPDTLVVVPLGVDPRRESETADAALPDGVTRYVLFVGEAEPRKDLGTLVNAMSKLDEPLRNEVALVVAGRRAHWRNFGHPAGVRTLVLGAVEEVRLAALYRGAAAFVFPSTYEGFGLPVLEAMAYGAPVVASSAASIPEAGGDAALYFPTGDATALATQLTRVLTDAELAQRLRFAGQARAATMTWDRCAEQTLSVLERFKT